MCRISASAQSIVPGIRSRTNIIGLSPRAITPRIQLWTCNWLPSSVSLMCSASLISRLLWVFPTYRSVLFVGSNSPYIRYLPGRLLFAFVCFDEVTVFISLQKGNSPSFQSQLAKQGASGRPWRRQNAQQGQNDYRVTHSIPPKHPITIATI